MTKEQLSDKLRAAISPLIEDFSAQPSPGSSANEEKRKEIEERREILRKGLGEDDPAYRAASDVLNQALDGLKLSESQQRKENLRIAAEALIHVTNTLRMPMKLKTKAESGLGAASKAGTSTDGRRFRKTAKALAEETAAVMKILPRSNAGYMSKGEINEKVGFDATSALLKLKREGEANSNGRRGSGGGWRKV